MNEIQKKLEQELKKINWSLKDYGCEHYKPVDHKGKVSKYVIFGNEIKTDRGSDDCLELTSFQLTMENIKHKPHTIRDNYFGLVSVGDERNFIIFMNHDKKGEEDEQD